MSEDSETEMTDEDVKRLILATAGDLGARFFYYDRKEDEELPLGIIENALERGIVTKAEIVEQFWSGAT